MFSALEIEGFLMNNTHRSLKSVVSVDGWIAEFDENDTASVHVDVVFKTAIFGDGANDKVSFRIDLLRADIIICVPEGEPLKVIKSTLHREPNTASGSRKTSKVVQTDAEASGEIAVGLNTAPIAKANAKAKLQAAVTTEEETNETIKEFISQHFSFENSHPAWEVKRADGKKMTGTPWSAVEEPRLKAKRLTERNADGGKPTLKVEIRCRREDIEISGLKMTDLNEQKRFMNRNNKAKNIAAAEQLIKDELAKAGFMELPDMANPNVQLLIADTIIGEEW